MQIQRVDCIQPIPRGHTKRRGFHRAAVLHLEPCNGIELLSKTVKLHILSYSKVFYGKGRKLASLKFSNFEQETCGLGIGGNFDSQGNPLHPPRILYYRMSAAKHFYRI